MWAAHRFCSEFGKRRVIRGLRLAGLGAMLAVTGCTASKTLDVSGVDLQANGTKAERSTLVAQDIKRKTLPPVTKKVAAINQTADLKPGAKNTSLGKVQTVKAKSAFSADEVIEQKDPVYMSPRCRRILAVTGITSTLLRSPTVSANVNDDGDVGASISYDVVDLRRADIKERLALAQCRRSFAATRLAALLVTSPQALTRAGYLAQANSLRASRSRFKKIDYVIRKSVREGVITFQRGNGLRQYLDQVRGVEARARGEAARREVIDTVQNQKVRGLDQELVRAEREISRLERKLRTADAVQVSLSGGYSHNSVLDSDQDLGDQGDAYARVKVSMRLGAFRHRRQELEDIAEESRIESLNETGSGLFWRANELARANNRALKSMRKQRSELRASIKKAKSNARIVSPAYAEELLAPSLRAKIDVIALEAELSGLQATIVDTNRVGRKLRFK